MPYLSAVTFQAMQLKVSKKLIDAAQSAVASSDVADALNDALNYWKQKRFFFNEAQTTLTMDVNDPFVLGYGNSNPSYPGAPVLPQDFLYEFPKDGFVINYSNLSYRFDKVDPSYYDDTSIRGVGIPYIYTFRNGNYEFYFFPNLAYELQVNYIKDVPDMVNNDDTNIFTQYAPRLLMYEALSHLMGENRQDETSDSQYAQKADRESKMLRYRGGTQVTSGKLSINTIL